MYILHESTHHSLFLPPSLPLSLSLFFPPSLHPSSLPPPLSIPLPPSLPPPLSGIQSLVHSSMEESLVQILSPKRRVDILRDVMDVREKGRPYTITFCGVNGVGKSTNLAKVSSSDTARDIDSPGLFSITCLHSRVLPRPV